MKICIIILHYQNFEITKQCIENIRTKVDKNKYEVDIVVVDNASPNCSGKKLKEYYANTNVHFVFMKSNVGFARGNNAGFICARKNLDPDIVILMNNDILIEDDYFFDILIKKFSENNYNIVVPDIVNLASVHQNPLRTKPVTFRDIRKTRWSLLKLYIMTYIPIVFKRKGETSDAYGSERSKLSLMPMKNIVPHGSCIILGKEFIKNEHFVFDPITFMFREEDLFYERVRQKGYDIYFEPELIVKHCEDMSINTLDKDKRKIKRFIARETLKSLGCLEFRLKMNDKKYNSKN